MRDPNEGKVHNIYLYIYIYINYIYIMPHIYTRPRVYAHRIHDIVIYRPNAFDDAIERDTAGWHIGTGSLHYNTHIAILYYNISYKMNIHIVVAAHLFQASRRNSTVDLLIAHRCTKGRNGYYNI